MRTGQAGSRWAVGRLGAVLVALAALACSAAAGAQAASPAAVLPATRAALAAVLKQAQAQGFQGEVLVADTQGIWFESATGLARRQPDMPHRVGAVWRWGSVSKQVTVTLAMQEVDAGRLRLDDTLAARWPELPMPNAERITVRHLMQHLSGMTHIENSPADADGVLAFYRRSGPPWLPEALRFCAGTPNDAPGERFHYNDCDTLVLAGLLERVSGRSYVQLLQQRLSRPLGLRSVRLNEGRALAQAEPVDAAGKAVPQPVMASYGAAGALEGTARDLLAFNRALIGGRLVSAGARQAMWTGEPRWGYAALGVWAFAAPLAGCTGAVELVERRGYVGGIQARNIIAPESGLSLIMFTNNADYEFGEIWQGRGFSHDLLAAALCPAPAAPAASSAPAPASMPK